MQPNGSSALSRLSSNGQVNAGWCLSYCQDAWQVPHEFSDAASQWANTEQYTDMSNIPHGAPVFWLGGHGHIALWDAVLQAVRTTDLPTEGRVGIVGISVPGQLWGKHLVGWGGTLAGQRLPLSTPSAPAARPAQPGRVFGSVGPVVSLENVRASILRDGPAKQGWASNKGNSLPVEEALARVAGLPRQYVDGSLGGLTFGHGSAYQRWQVRCGWTGAAADGYPPVVLTGVDSFSRLANASKAFRAAA